MKIMILPCDGIGPEITAATVTALEAVDSRLGLDLSLQFADIGLASLKTSGTSLPESVFDEARQADGVILGPQSNLEYPPLEQGGRNVSAAFRVGMDLYANVRPARSRDFLGNESSGAPGMDLVIMREATEGFYPDRNMHAGSGEFMPTPDMAMSVRKITAAACERIARAGFELAMTRDRHVTAVHKANVFKLSDGLFLEQVRQVAGDYPEVRVDDVLVDAMAAMLVRQPAAYDVIITTNFYGDILSDLASELSGSLGLAGSINANSQTGKVCAQAQHGSAPDIAGRNVANPTSLILSTAMMLHWLGEQRSQANLTQAGQVMADAVDNVLHDPAGRPADLGGDCATDDFGRRVAQAIAAMV